MENTRFGKLYVLVMKILGKSLAQLEEDNGGKFSPKTVYMIGIQLVSPLPETISILIRFNDFTFLSDVSN